MVEMSKEIEKENEFSPELLKAYLKEWELCQSNLNRHNVWFWQVGSIFVALSFGALFATSQIKEMANQMILIWILAIFSVSIMTFWGFIFWRAKFYLGCTHDRLEQIEKRLKENLNYGYNEKLLHTLIKERDKQCGCPPHTTWIPMSLIIMVFIFWVVLLFHYYSFF